MHSALIKMLPMAILTVAAFAQEGAAKNEPQPVEVRRLESVTWDLKTHTLKWTVQKGTEVNGEFVPTAAIRYEVAPDEAVMKLDGEKRGFELGEAVSLHRLLDTLSIYCAQSVVWWDRGEGTRITDDKERVVPPPSTLKPERPAEKPDAKPTENGKPEHKQKALPIGVAEVAGDPPRVN